MNAANMNGTSATWDLLLAAPYEDRGGGENSSRVFGDSGWDMVRACGETRRDPRVVSGQSSDAMRVVSPMESCWDRR